MTFKHVKFEDSPIMRSLEKVAKEKGLVKPEAIQKTAAVTKKADVTPTSNLMENIFKLCNGMRAQGLDKEAAEVEMHFLNYKRAQTLYEAHKEKGEDLIHAAHPEGSHKLEGVEGDEATFEDILDKHVKIMQKVEKMPTGKLSSAAQIVRAVKMALGQEEPKYDPKLIANWYRYQTLAKLEKAKNYGSTGLSACLRAVRAGFVVADQYVGKDYEDIAKSVQRSTTAWMNMYNKTSELSADGVNEMIAGLQEAKENAQMAFSYDDAASTLRNEATSNFDQAIRVCKEALSTVQSFNADPNSLPIGVSAPAQPADISKPGKQNFMGRLTSLDRNLKLYASYVPVRIAPSAQGQANKIIANYQAQVKALLDYLKDASDQEATSKAGDIEQLEKWVTDFGTSWKLSSPAATTPSSQIAAK
jgi:hypothetical protein